MGTIPRFLLSAVPGYKILDIKEWLVEGKIEIFLERDAECPSTCYWCGSVLTSARGRHRMKVEGMPIMGLRTFFYFWREKRHCVSCKKARSEAVSFLAKESPHLTLEYAWWIGRLCEIAAVTR
jgi:transposase